MIGALVSLCAAVRIGGVAGYAPAPPRAPRRTHGVPPATTTRSPRRGVATAAVPEFLADAPAHVDALRHLELPSLTVAAYDALRASPAAVAYDALLGAHPLATKAWTNGLVAFLGDALAQSRDPAVAAYDRARGLRFCAKAVVGGAMWVGFYDLADAATAELAGSARVAASVALEQLVWAPLYFAFYDLPAASLLNGVAPDDAPAVVKRMLPSTLLASAKIWTPANILVYSAPLEYRLAVSNAFDLLWSTVNADIAVDCTAGPRAPKPVPVPVSRSR